MPCYFPDFLSFLNSSQRDALVRFAEELSEEAVEAGLISSKDREIIWERHILDSLLPLALQEARQILAAAASLADLGSGAGLPAIPLAIALPQLKILSIDMREKAIFFQERAKRKLALENLEIYQGAVESLPYEKKTEVVVFRAFHTLVVSLELSLYALRPEGKLLYYGAGKVMHGDLVSSQIHELGFCLKNIVSLPSKKPRWLAIFELCHVPRPRFPRSWRQIMKERRKAR
ncbi:MAG: 16S rRNA (guanine(527)-N(7))-methyltransferase RsmG [Leptospiraceae bacterium]|nr:16S rRNA (guanine(527)-N(7))-methyltransferase RsmG [Leptospiraceae bacterium]